MVRAGIALVREAPAAQFLLAWGVLLATVLGCLFFGAPVAAWLAVELLALQYTRANYADDSRVVPPVAWRAKRLLLGWWLGVALCCGAVWVLGAVLCAGGLGGFRLGAFCAAALLLPLWLGLVPYAYVPLLIFDNSTTSLSSLLQHSVQRCVTAGYRRPAAALFLARVVPWCVLAASCLAWVQPWSMGVRGGIALGGSASAALAWMFGQAALVAGFVEPQERPSRSERLVTLQGPRWAVWLWRCAFWAYPLASLGLLASLLVPARLAAGPLPEPGGWQNSLLQVQDFDYRPPGQHFELSVRPDRLQVHTADGGGAGNLPLREWGPIRGVRVVQTEQRVGLEVVQGSGQRTHTYLSAVGVRLDDDGAARLLDRVPPWAWWSLLLAAYAFVAASLATFGPRGGRGSLRLAVMGLGVGPLWLWSLYWSFRAVQWAG